MFLAVVNDEVCGHQRNFCLTSAGIVDKSRLSLVGDHVGANNSSWVSVVSIEACIWNYQYGEPIGFAFDIVRDILSTDATDWSDEYGCLTVRFRNPDDSVDIHLGKNALATNHVPGIMVFRPIAHSDYLARILEIMRMGNVMLFYSDETTPIFVRGADVTHYPSDLLEQLGQPRFVDSPTELLHQT